MATEEIKEGASAPSPVPSVTETKAPMAHVQESLGAPEKKPHIHWTVPATMLVYVLVGLALALGHHFFNASLDGDVVGSPTSQEWNMRIGTGLSALIQTLLTGAVGTACLQAVWRLLHKKAVKVSTIDSLFGVTGDSWKLLDLTAWMQGPMVLGLALLCWLIPYAAVVPPDTLTVQPAPFMAATTQMVKIPLINWTYPMYETMGAGQYHRNSADMQRIARSVAYGGNMLSIPAPAPNSSYALQFWGPTVKCVLANSSVTDAFNSTWRSFSWPYTSVVPASANLTADLVAFQNASLSLMYSVPYLDRYSPDMARIYIATKSQAIDGKSVPPVVRECGLYNATYDVHFQFDNGQQSVTVRNLTDLRPFQYFFNPNGGSLFSPHTNNFLSLFEAFGRIVVGSLSWSASLQINMDTETLNTALINSIEMRSILDVLKETGSGDTGFLESEIANLGGGRNYTLAEAAEELFQNLTLSLYGTSAYRNALEVTDPTELTIFGPLNIYAYEPRNLALAYALAIGFSLLGVALGVMALRANGASYSYDFSSLLRLTRSPDLSEAIYPDETGGAEPLPDHLAKAKLQLVSMDAPDGTMYKSFVVCQDGSK